MAGKKLDTSWLPYMAKTKNYNRWVFEQYRDHIGDSILDVGAGLGTFVDYIKNRKKIILLEIEDENVKRLKIKYKGYKNIKAIKGDLSKQNLVPEIKREKINTVICLNTLEHIKTDKLMIANIRRSILPKGKLILYVPALKALYGTLDKNLGHYRRYQKDELEQLLVRNRFKIIKSRYLNSFGTLSWFLYSRILKRKKVKEKRILAYDRWLVPIISKMESLLNLPFGQSLLIIAEAVQPATR